MADQLPDDRIRQGSPLPPPTSIQANLPAGSEAPPLPRLGSSSSGLGGLSSLAQSAREKQINRARTILMVVGGLTIVLSIVMSFVMRNNLDNEIRKAGFNVNRLPPDVQAQVDAALFIGYALIGISVVVGIVFIVLGVLVRQYPVFCTVTGLVVYIVDWLAAGLIDPENFAKNLAAGAIIKIIIIVALFKAVQAALAAEKEKRDALAGLANEF